MFKSGSERKWKEEEHLETWVWAGALVVGWFSASGSLQTDLAFLLLSRCPSVFPSTPDFPLGMGLFKVRVQGSGGRTDSWIALMPTPIATFTAARFRSLSVLLNFLVMLVSRNSCLCSGGFGKRQSTKSRESGDSSLPNGIVFQSLLRGGIELANLLLL